MLGLTWLPLSLLVLVTTSQYLPSEDCPLLGPSFPKAFDLSNATAIRNLQQTFPSLIESVLASGAIDRTHTSFTIDVFSAATNKSIYSYHHAAPALNGSLTADVLDDETIYRIGSVSKVFTMYAILAHGGGMAILNEPVTKYLPELAGNVGKDAVEKIVWEDVSIGALASQLGGTGGFPVQSISCYNGSQSDCSIPDFLTTMRNQKRPTAPPLQTPFYSDAGFGILGRVLERLTNLTYAEAIQQILATPLGLNHTSTLEPPSDGLNALIVPGNYTLSSWSFDDQITAPSGGIYSSAEDLRTLGLSILHSQLLPANSWLKPHSHTASLTNSVGAPWEISRLPLPVSPNSNRTRISDLYTKTGGQNGYGTFFALSPDHDLGFSVLLAGETALTDRWPLRAIVGEAWIAAAEQAAWENARQNYVGVFVDESLPGTNLTLSVDANRPGVGLESFFISGEEVRPYILELQGEIPAANLSVRLYPMGLNSWDEDREVEIQSWRAIPTVVPTGVRGIVQGGEGMFDDGCMGWLSVDFNLFEVNGVDGFVFEVKEGRVEAVSNSATGVVLKRIG